MSNKADVLEKVATELACTAFHQGAAAGAEMVLEVLKDIGMPEDAIEQLRGIVKQAISQHYQDVSEGVRPNT